MAFGDLLHGIPIGPNQVYTGSFWDLLQPYAVYTGITFVALCLLHGGAFIALKTTGPVHDRTERTLRTLAPVTTALVAGFAIWTVAIAQGRVGVWVVVLIAVATAIAATVLVASSRDGAAFATTAVTIGTGRRPSASWSGTARSRSWRWRSPGMRRGSTCPAAPSIRARTTRRRWSASSARRPAS